MFIYDWFILTLIIMVSINKLVIEYTLYSIINTVLKCAESLAAAKAPTLTAARKRQYWPRGGS